MSWRESVLFSVEMANECQADNNKCDPAKISKVNKFGVVRVNQKWAVFLRCTSVDRRITCLNTFLVTLGTIYIAHVASFIPLEPDSITVRPPKGTLPERA